QFSRFIKPGAKRIACTSSSDYFIATGFINPNNEVVVVIHNLSDCDRDFQIWVDGKVLKYNAPAKAVLTILF
ncbi:MAG: glycosyl hydrolase, partial [Candidatus Neomarinimicrobiota bacterium]